MWEEQMGGRASARGTSSTGGGGSAPPPLRRTRSLTDSEKAAQVRSHAREAAGAQLKERYQQIDAVQKSRQIVQLAPNQLPKRKGAPNSGRGTGGARPRVS